MLSGDEDDTTGTGEDTGEDDTKGTDEDDTTGEENLLCSVM